MLEEENNISAYLYMLGGAFAFALMGSLSHLVAEYCAWPFVVFARAMVGFVFSISLAKLANVELVLWKPATLWLRSLAGSVGIICSFYALTHLPITDAIALTNTFPIWAALLVWLVIGQKPDVSVWVAIVLGVAGIILIQQPHFDGNILACLIALCNALCISIAILGLNRLKAIDSRAVVAHFSGVSMIMSALILFATGNGKYVLTIPNKTALVLLLAVGLTGTMGQLGMTLAFAKGNVARVPVIGLSEILFGLGFDVFLWKRTVYAITICGLLLVIVPTAWLLINHTFRNATLKQS